MRERLWSTVAIWLAFMITAVVLIAVQAAQSPRVFSDGMVFSLMGMLVMGAVAGTRMVWMTFRSTERQGEQVYYAKAKRSHDRRLERLADTLDADELADLETILAARSRGRERH